MRTLLQCSLYDLLRPGFTAVDWAALSCKLPQLQRHFGREQSHGQVLWLHQRTSGGLTLGDIIWERTLQGVGRRQPIEEVVGDDPGWAAPGRGRHRLGASGRSRNGRDSFVAAVRVAWWLQRVERRRLRQLGDQPSAGAGPSFTVTLVGGGVGRGFVFVAGLLSSPGLVRKRLLGISDLLGGVLVNTLAQTAFDAVNHTLRGLRLEGMGSFAANRATGTEDEMLEARLLAFDARTKVGAQELVHLAAWEYGTWAKRVDLGVAVGDFLAEELRSIERDVHFGALRSSLGGLGEVRDGAPRGARRVGDVLRRWCFCLHLGWENLISRDVVALQVCVNLVEEIALVVDKVLAQGHVYLPQQSPPVALLIVGKVLAAGAELDEALEVQRWCERAAKEDHTCILHMFHETAPFEEVLGPRNELLHDFVGFLFQCHSLIELELGTFLSDELLALAFASVKVKVDGAHREDGETAEAIRKFSHAVATVEVMAHHVLDEVVAEDHGVQGTVFL